MLANRAAKGLSLRSFSARRFASSDAKVVVVGAGQYRFCSPDPIHATLTWLNHIGAAGLTAVNQLHKSLRKSGKTLSKEDIVIVDPAEYHYYQPGWWVITYALNLTDHGLGRLSALV